MHPLTELVVGLLNLLLLTKIFRIETFATLGLMIAHRHPLATASANDDPLQQGWSFTWGAVATIFSVGSTIFSQLAQVGFVLFPADVTRMGLSDEKRPLLLAEHCGPKAPNGSPLYGSPCEHGEE